VPMIINGSTQPGSTANDLAFGDDATWCVVLESGDPSVTIGLHVPSSVPDDMDVHLYGLAYSGFSDEAIDLQGGSGHSVTGSRFGGNASGHALLANGNNLRVGTNAHHVTIGGDDVADRNIIGGATGSGIALFGSGLPPTATGTHDNQIINNLIGLGWSISSAHVTDLGNGARGVYISGHDNTVSGNDIGSNTTAGVILTGGAAYNNAVVENFIGFFEGSDYHGNGQNGVQIAGAAGDAPSSNSVLRNVISYNGAQGVWVQIGRGNTVRRNGIYGNAGLGIDLDVAGTMINDNDAVVPTPDFANRGLNYPVLASALGGFSHGTFSGSLDSTLGTYRIDFYDNPGGCSQVTREGVGWVGSTVVTISIAQIGGNGSASFQVEQGPGDLGGLPGGAGIVATATDSVGNTSEFSACIPYVNDTIFANGFDANP
jgi:parallel beta-helix repeat protein